MLVQIKHIKSLFQALKNFLRFISKILKSRSAIEPVVGHLKNAHRLGRNYVHYVLGKIGDHVNAILSDCAFNLKK